MSDLNHSCVSALRVWVTVVRAERPCRQQHRRRLGHKRALLRLFGKQHESVNEHSLLLGFFTFRLSLLIKPEHLTHHMSYFFLLVTITLLSTHVVDAKRHQLVFPLAVFYFEIQVIFTLPLDRKKTISISKHWCITLRSVFSITAGSYFETWRRHVVNRPSTLWSHPVSHLQTSFSKAEVLQWH